MITIFLFLSTIQGFSQTYAPVDFYLVDSLDLSTLGETDKELIDSCLKSFHAAKSDTSKIKSLDGICSYMMHEDWAKYQFFQHDFIKSAIGNNPSPKVLHSLNISLGSSYNNLGYIHEGLGDITMALAFYKKSITIKEELGDKRALANGYNNIGYIYNGQGNIPLALTYFNKCLKIYEEFEDKAGIANTYNNMGGIHDVQGDYLNALNYYEKSLVLREEIKDKPGMAISLNNIGHVRFNLNEHDLALEQFNKSLKIRKEIGDKSGLAYSYNNIANVYSRTGEIETALNFYNEALKIYSEFGDKKGMALCYYNIGSVERDQYKENGQKDLLKSAKLNGILSMKLAQEVGYLREIKTAASLLYEIAKEENDNTTALAMHELFTEIKDSIASEENVKASMKQEYKYKYEKQAAEDSIKALEATKVQDALLYVEQAENARQRQQSYFLYGGLGLALLFGAFIFNRLNITRKQKVVIEEAHDQLEEKNQEIMDSINYAKRIQSAILPSSKLVKEYLQESFILYKPKDIVAGDFYWMEHKNGKVLFAAADCTGHGVPGAMVSVICNNGLNRSVREHGLTDPGKILDKTREIVIAEFQKSEDEVKDGMDIALCSLSFPAPSSSLNKDKATEEKQGTENQEQRTAAVLQYAGAHNPLWIIRTSPDGRQNGKVLETKANKQPIGKFDKQSNYTTHTFNLEKGDAIYIFSDGYVDQFGGDKGKKFKSKAFKELLISIQDKSMEEQKKIIDDAFEAWRGDLEQIDDVCVIGVRI